MKKFLLGCGVVGVIGGVAAVLLIIVGIIVAVGYNGLVGLSQGVDKQWAQVQNVYQRRADLIPNVIKTVEGAANFEKSTLTEITEARASVGSVKLDPNSAPTDPAKLAQFQAAQNQLGGALSRLMVVVERYPDLKANTAFMGLMTELEGTENRISVERGRFNDAVQSYDTAIKSFPAVLYSGAFGFQYKPYFEAAADAQTAPKVQFDFSNKPATPPPAEAAPAGR